MARRRKKGGALFGKVAYTLGLVASMLGVLTYLDLTPKPIRLEIGPVSLRIDESAHVATVKVELLDGPMEGQRFDVDVPSCTEFFKPFRLLEGDIKYLDEERWNLWQAHGAARH